MAATSRADHSETRLLRELILEHLSRWLWKTRWELQQSVERDFGPIGITQGAADRRFCRQLVLLRNAGALDMIIDETLDPPMPVYRRLPGARPEMAGTIPHLFCKKCGLVNAQTRGHRNGHRRFVERGLPMLYVTFAPARTPPPDAIRNPVARLRLEAQQTSAGTPDSPQPAAISSPPRHPRPAARRAR